MELLSKSIATDGEKNGVILSLDILAILLISYDYLAIRIWLFQLGWYGSLDKLSMMSLHVGADAICHVLVEPSEED